MIYVGAYPARVTSATLTPHIHELAAVDDVGGFELPWESAASLSAMAQEISLIAPGRRVMVTDIGWTMSATARDPDIGLASRVEAGRRRAVEEARSLARTVQAVNTLSPNLICAVEIHSAPQGGEDDALHRSLTELVAEDWGGAQLFLEHVDARRPDHAPAKGFLSLQAEVAVLRELNLGLVVNWARSVIEHRSPTGALMHIHAARTAGVLRAVFFSGVASVDSRYGGAWADAHLPFAEVEPVSLLTEAHARSAVVAAGTGVILGVKMTDTGFEGSTPLMFRRAVQTVADASRAVVKLAETEAGSTGA